MSSDREVVLSSSLFDGLTEEQKREAYAWLDGHYLDYEKGETIVHEEDVVTTIGIVVHGAVTTAKLDSMGNSSLLYTLEPTFVYGLDICLTPSKVSPMNICAASDSRVFVFEGTRLGEPHFLEDTVRSRMLLNALQVLANENMRRMYKIEILCQRSLRERIFMYLRHMARRRHSKSFDIPFDRDQLAQYLGVNRSSLSHELSLMQQEGLITFQKNRFMIHEGM